MNRELRTIPMLGFRLSPFGLQENVELILAEMAAKRVRWLMTLNLEMVARAERDPEYRSLIERHDWAVADGMPIVWASRVSKNQASVSGRTNGTDLVESLLRRISQEKDATVGRVGIVGGACPRSAIARLGIDPEVVGFVFDGSVKPDDQLQVRDLVRSLVAADCRLALIALGVPKQDVLATALVDAGFEGTCIGVGGALDFLAGIKRRAPVWMQNAGLEWLHRLATEPRRLWRRYVFEYPVAIRVLTREVINAKIDRRSDPY